MFFFVKMASFVYLMVFPSIILTYLEEICLGIKTFLESIDISEEKRVCNNQLRKTKNRSQSTSGEQTRDLYDCQTYTYDWVSGCVRVNGQFL